EVHRGEQQACRVHPAEPVGDELVGQLVVLRRGLPAHPAEHPDQLWSALSHPAILPSGCQPKVRRRVRFHRFAGSRGSSSASPAQYLLSATGRCPSRQRMASTCPAAPTVLDSTSTIPPGPVSLRESSLNARSTSQVIRLRVWVSTIVVRAYRVTREVCNRAASGWLPTAAPTSARAPASRRYRSAAV